MSQNRYVNGKDGHLQLTSAPIETLEAGFVRVEPRALAINPIDVKVLAYQVAIGSGAGCDFAGVITELGPGVAGLSIGDTVAGGVPGSDPDNHAPGAFAESLVIHADSLYKFPTVLETNTSDSIPFGPVKSFEQASSLGIGVGTSIVATELFNKVPFKKNSVSGWALVYGAAGSLGWYTTQVYQYMGYKVIAVASKKHKEAFSALGIEHLVDYHDNDWPEQVRKITGDDLTLAYDTIALGETTAQINRAISTTKTSRIHTSLLIAPEDQPKISSNVTIDPPLWFSFWNKTRRIGPWVTNSPDEFLQKRPEIFNEINEFLKTVVSMPISVAGDGLEAIPAAYKQHDKGASLEKIVVRIPKH